MSLTPFHDVPLTTHSVFVYDTQYLVKNIEDEKGTSDDDKSRDGSDEGIGEGDGPDESDESDEEMEDGKSDDDEDELSGAGIEGQMSDGKEDDAGALSNDLDDEFDREMEERKPVIRKAVLDASVEICSVCEAWKNHFGSIQAIERG
ncbi:hypothetical protein QBC36DRAFT_380159 [Triangularia setosa]|uniref:Uncharacterized protein n=1 Tax=Triangularia setosa TaxID=2587417 RepID=A0AAN7A3W2_9PEZI|nr:hypothetical protein QBC36DRAFT_380159 [Podospora setosa]